jgi:hypothetical protein
LIENEAERHQMRKRAYEFGRQMVWPEVGRRYLELFARAAAEWLLGRNRPGARLYDFSTGACADGLDAHGVSMNQGAESVICGLLGLLAVSAQIEKEAEQTNSDVIAPLQSNIAAGESGGSAKV